MRRAPCDQRARRPRPPSGLPVSPRCRPLASCRRDHSSTSVGDGSCQAVDASRKTPSQNVASPTTPTALGGDAGGAMSLEPNAPSRLRLVLKSTTDLVLRMELQQLLESPSMP